MLLVGAADPLTTSEEERKKQNLRVVRIPDAEREGEEA
jgi:hypothetical protein